MVDTVGAGDTFDAGVLASLKMDNLLTKAQVANLDEQALRNALALGAKAAAVTVSRAGANPPWAKEIGAVRLFSQILRRCLETLKATPSFAPFFRAGARLAFLLDRPTDRTDLLHEAVERVDEIVLDQGVMDELTLLLSPDQTPPVSRTERCCETAGLDMLKRSAISPAVRPDAER